MVRIGELKSRRFNFVIIGGGTAGCLVAARIASHLPTHTVLLIEAGNEDADDPENLVLGLCKPKFGSASGNWLYETEAQEELGGRSIIYPRGRGLGGCSANNFMAWVKGPDVDYDDWAEIVGYPWWKWDNVNEVLKSLEDFDPRAPNEMQKCAVPVKGMHGTGGPIGVQYGREWQGVITLGLLASEQAGHHLNPDNNSGDPTGFSVAQFNVKNASRITSAVAFLNSSRRDSLSNLTVVTNALCSKINFNGTRASGVTLMPFPDFALAG